MDKERTSNNQGNRGRYETHKSEGQRYGQGDASRNRSNGSRDSRENREYRGGSHDRQGNRDGQGYQGSRTGYGSSNNGKGGTGKNYQKPSGRNQGGNRFYDKDKDADYEKKDMHRKPMGTSKDKAKEQTTDKMEVVKRLEKEKKAMQKKNQGKKNQQSRPQVRVKRTNNIDWTKEYENDSYDDDDMYYNY